MYLSKEHVEMFKSGSKPDNWKINPPSLNNLSIMFKGQMEQIKEHIGQRSFDE